MAPENDGYKLTYFDIVGRGDFIRLIFAYKHIPFEDNRVASLDDWYKTIKPTMPMGQMPLLELPGKRKLCQSYAIGRYLGREFDMMGSDNLENAQIDAQINFLEDVITTARKIIFASLYNPQMTEDERIAEWKHNQAEVYPNGLKILNDYLSKKSSGFFSEKGVTWADFVLFTWQRAFLEFAKKSASEYPALEKHHKIMLEIPECAEYWAKHGNDRMSYYKYNENDVPTFSP